MKTKLIILSILVAMLSACSTTNYESYTKATEAREARITKEAESKQLVDQTLLLQVAKVSQDCKDPMCQMGVLLVLSNLKNQSTQSAHTPAPVIQAPTNDSLEWAKVIINGVGGVATGLYGIRATTALGMVNATKGPADIDAAKEGLSTLDIYRTTAGQ